MFRIDQRNKTLSNILIKKDGYDFRFNKSQLKSNSEFFIVSCSSIEYVYGYLTDTSKRYYIMLDKDIRENEYSSLDEDNKWFIKTDMKLPNMIVSNDLIYMISLDKHVVDKEIIEHIYNFFNSKFLEYSNKFNDINVRHDVMFYDNGFVKSVQSLPKCDYILSNEKFNEMIVTSDVKLLSHGDVYLEESLIDYATLVNDGTAYSVINAPEGFYIINLQEEFDIHHYKHYLFKNQMTLTEINQDDCYSSNLEKINVNDVSRYSFEVTVDEGATKEKIDKLVEENACKIINKNNPLSMDVEFEYKINYKEKHKKEA